MLNRFVRSWLVPGNQTSGAFLRGFPSKTMEAQVELEAIANRIRASTTLRERVTRCAAAGLLPSLNRTPEGREVVDQIDEYLK